MDELSLLIDLHKDNLRQGPGGDAQTLQALELAGLDNDSPLAIADIGCGTGASSLLLANTLNQASIKAVDFLPDFLSTLSQRTEQQKLVDRITPVCASMDDLPFEKHSLDIIWSEGAIYNIGFNKGLEYWRQFLKPGGIIAVSEITWLSEQRPSELDQHWTAQYADIATAATKIAQLERAGFSPQGYFVLPQACWLNNYYRPLQESFEQFLQRNDHSPAAQAIVAAEQQEIALYEKYQAFYSYGFYVAKLLE